MLVLAADHHIADPAAFRAAVADGAELVSEDRLLTFGIVPGSSRDRLRLHQGRRSDRRRRARKWRSSSKSRMSTRPRKYLAAGGYLLEQRHVHVQGEHVSERTRSASTGHLQRLRKRSAQHVERSRLPSARAPSSRKCPSESIDYAVMEKTHRSVVLPINVGWSDVGSWKALWEVSPRDSGGNHVRGDVVAVDTSGSLLISEGRLARDRRRAAT